jgi:nucleotide-binding universal stress UspA family protein
MRIILATDGTKQGEGAVEALRKFALDSADEVKLICVVDMSVPIGVDVYGGFLPDTAGLELAARDSAQKILDTATDAVREMARSSGAAISGELLFGSPDSRIVEAAEEFKADLIIVGSHGYNRWERLLLGSVSDSVVHHAPCSVLVVRTPDEEKPAN